MYNINLNIIFFRFYKYMNLFYDYNALNCLITLILL